MQPQVRTDAMLSLPFVPGTGVKSHQGNDDEESTIIDSKSIRLASSGSSSRQSWLSSDTRAPSARSSREHTRQRVQPPHCERPQSSFHRGRQARAWSTTTDLEISRISVTDVYTAIQEQVPQAQIVQVHEDDTDSMDSPDLISISSPHDFGKLVEGSVPAFIIAENSEETVNLTSQLIRSQSQANVGAVIVVLLDNPALVNYRLVASRVAELVASGADDVIAMPTDIQQLSFSVSVSLAKAGVTRQRRISLERQLRASKKQCEQLFWQNAHEIVQDFPQEREDLIEIQGKRVGSFALVRKLGEGAFGEVHQCEDRKGRKYAVKVLPKRLVKSADHAINIVTEFALLQKLGHPNVVRAQKLVHGMENVYLFLEFAGKNSLFQIIRSNGDGGLMWAQVKHLFLQIASGLAHCHKMQTAHCDLKPENIVISAAGEAKIVDFGQAVDLTADVQLQAPRGTMPFMAPEVMCINPTWDPAASDVWALGVVFMEMLCGNHAFLTLLGWKGQDIKSRPALVQRAGEVANFFAKQDMRVRRNTLQTVANLCHDMPPPSAIDLLGNMLEMAPGDRVLAESALQRMFQETS